MRLCILVCALCLGGFSFASRTVVGQVEDRLRPFSFGDIDRDIKHFVAQFKQASVPADQQTAVSNLCLVYYQLTIHPHFAHSEKLRGMRSRVRHHLRDMEKQLKRDARDRAPPVPDGSEGPLADESRQSPGEANTSLASSWVDTPLADNFSTLLQFSGGPAQLYAYGWNFGGTANAMELISLIQSTIAPLHWDINDGPGHIHYYSPQGLLVIRAGNEVHGEVGDLLQQLRDNQ